MKMVDLILANDEKNCQNLPKLIPSKITCYTVIPWLQLVNNFLLLQTHLSEEHKSTILLNIKRNTPQEKLFDLLKWTDKVKSMKERKVT